MGNGHGVGSLTGAPGTDLEASAMDETSGSPSPSLRSAASASGNTSPRVGSDEAPPRREEPRHTAGLGVGELSCSPNGGDFRVPGVLLGVGVGMDEADEAQTGVAQEHVFRDKA